MCCFSLEFVKFFCIYFEALLLCACKFKIIMSPLSLDPLIIIKSPISSLVTLSVLKIDFVWYYGYCRTLLVVQFLVYLLLSFDPQRIYIMKSKVYPLLRTNSWILFLCQIDNLYLLIWVFDAFIIWIDLHLLFCYGFYTFLMPFCFSIPPWLLFYVK